MHQNDIEFYKLCTPFHDKKHTLHEVNRRDRNGGQIIYQERWNTQRMIGSGQFGRVWVQANVSENLEETKARVRAVKELEKWRLVDKEIDYKRELDTLIQFSQNKYEHRHTFVEFFNWFEDSDYVFIAMEYIPLGGLHQYIRLVIDEDEAKQIAMQILKGLNYMHEIGYTHRDIKPENILVVTKQPESLKWWIKLADFGCTKRIRNNDTVLRTELGTKEYQAPEFFPDCLQELGYNPELAEHTNAVDLWSFACIVYQIMAHQLPFHPHGSPRAFCLGGGRDFPITPFNKEPGVRTSELCIAFIKSVLKPLPSDRPSAISALQHPWFSTIYGLSDQLTGSASPEIFENVTQPSPQPSQTYQTSIVSSNSSICPVAKPKPSPSRQTTYDQAARRRPPRNQYLHRKRPDPPENK